MPEGGLGRWSYLLDRHYLIVTLDKSCHLPGLSFFTFLMEDVGQKLDLPAFLIPALRAAALGLAPGTPPGPRVRAHSQGVLPPSAQMAS